MSTLYLVRHGEPDFPEGQKVCIGKTDLPLSEVGISQAKKLSYYFKDINKSLVLVSPLVRCLETVRYICDSYKVVNDLREIDMGLWEGLPFSKIKKHWPKDYELRGKDPLNVPAPKGESLSELKERVEKALLLNIPKGYEGEIIVVAHNSVNNMISDIYGKPRDFDILNSKQEYGSVKIINF